MEFTIDGRDYPCPDVDTFTMGERRVLFDLSGIVQEDFVPLEHETEQEHRDRTRNLRRHPGFMQALMHVAYQRGNPNIAGDRVAAVIENTNYIEAITKWSESVREADTDVPLERTNTHAPPSSTSRSGEPTSSGGSSPNGSDQPDKSLVPIGTSSSPTSRTLAPGTWEF